MKLYTKSGDDGQTGLTGGRRLGKDDLRVSAYGEVDELNAALGLAAAGCQDDAWLVRIRHLQDQLFVLGAELADPDGQLTTPPLAQQDVTELESWIDDADRQVEPLANFVLPGGCEFAVRLHLARTISRRAERAVVRLAAREELGQVVIPFLNRLSDLLFAWARLANREAGIEDVVWRQRQD